jgi:hypothetical protein
MILSIAAPERGIDGKSTQYHISVLGLRPISTDNRTFEVVLHFLGQRIKSLLKKAPEPAIPSEARNSSSPKANKKRDSMLHRTSK